MENAGQSVIENSDPLPDSDGMLMTTGSIYGRWKYTWREPSTFTKSLLSYYFPFVPRITFLVQSLVCAAHITIVIFFRSNTRQFIFEYLHSFSQEQSI